MATNHQCQHPQNQTFSSRPRPGRGLSLSAQLNVVMPVTTAHLSGACQPLGRVHQARMSVDFRLHLFDLVAYCRVTSSTPQAVSGCVPQPTTGVRRGRRCGRWQTGKGPRRVGSATAGRDPGAGVSAWCGEGGRFVCRPAGFGHDDPPRPQGTGRARARRTRARRCRAAAGRQRARARIRRQIDPRARRQARHRQGRGPAGAARYLHRDLRAAPPPTRSPASCSTCRA